MLELKEEKVEEVKGSEDDKLDEEILTSTLVLLGKIADDTELGSRRELDSVLEGVYSEEVGEKKEVDEGS